MKYTPLFLALLFGVVAHTQADEPDLAYEARLHDIYLNFNSKPIAPGEWRSIVGERQSEVYGIQKGDTLWGISKTLFSDGNYWPKIWSLNGAIENPHLITEGNSIRFLMGNESEAPSFTVTDNFQTEEAEDVAVAHHPSEVEIPPPVVAPKPVLKKLPPSLPQWQEELNRRYDVTGFEFVRRPVLDLKSKIKVSAYFDEQAPSGVGVVKEMEAFGSSAGQMQYVYVDLPAGQYKKGDRFLVVRNMGELEKSHDSISSSSLGYQIQIQGEVSLDERAAGQRSDKDGREIYRALITRNINPVEIGGVLVRDPWLYADYSEQGPKSTVVAQIVGGSNDRKSQLFGSGSTVFLNRGAQDGLASGQILPIRSNRQVRDPKAIVWENARPVGYLKIVKVTPHLATAVVLKSFDDIFAGDLTGQGPLLPSEGVARTEESSVLEEMNEDKLDQEEEGTTVEDATESASSDDSLTDESSNTDTSSDEDSDLDSELE